LVHSSATTNTIRISFNISYNVNTESLDTVTKLPSIIKSNFDVNTFTTFLQQNAINYGTQFWLGGAEVDSTQQLSVIRVGAPLLAAQRPIFAPTSIPSTSSPIAVTAQTLQIAPIAAGGAVGLLVICVVVVYLIWYLNRDDRPKRAHLELYDSTIDTLEFGNVYGGGGGQGKIGLKTEGNEYNMTVSPMASPNSKLSPSKVVTESSPTRGSAVDFGNLYGKSKKGSKTEGDEYNMTVSPMRQSAVPLSPYAKSATEIRKSVTEKRKSAAGLNMSATGNNTSRTDAVAQLEETALPTTVRKKSNASTPPPPPPVKSAPKPVSLRSLTVTQVAALLKSQNLAKFTHAFATAKVSGAVLFEIQDNKDLQEIGIFMPTAVGFAFVKSLAGFRQNGVPASMLTE